MRSKKSNNFYRVRENKVIDEVFFVAISERNIAWSKIIQERKAEKGSKNRIDWT